MNPPKCRTCGEIEWAHVCRGKPKVRAVQPAAAPGTKKLPGKGGRVAARSATGLGQPVLSEINRADAAVPAPVDQPQIRPSAAPKAKTDRKEYLKLKARERRARERAARDAEKEPVV